MGFYFHNFTSSYLEYDDDSFLSMEAKLIFKEKSSNVGFEMKPMILMTVFMACMVASCNTNQKSNAYKKAQIDAILRGEEVILYALPTYGEEEGSGDDKVGPNKYSLRPYWSAVELGYSKEDLDKLKNLVIKLPTPKTAERQP